MIVAALMDLVDVTIVNVALPTVQRDLGASGTQIEWVVSAYMLAFAALLLLAGRLGDFFGRKRMFVVGVAAFGVASLLSAIAQDPTWLIASRTLQGAAAALLIPQVLATARAIFEGEERGAVFGVYGAIGGLATAGGLLLGGVLTDADLFGWGWRTIFVVNIPIASLALGLLGLAALGLVDSRRRDNDIAPLLPTRLFAYRAFAAGALLQMTFFAAMQGFFLTLALWLQAGQGFSPIRAGLTTVAFSLGAFVTAPIAPQLAVRAGRSVMVVGAILMAAGIVGVDIAAHHAGAKVSPWALVPGLLAAGAGLGFLVVPLINVVLSVVPKDEAGEASGVFSTAQQLGGALGVAIVGTIFFDRVGAAGFTAAFTHAAPFVAAGFAACGVLALALPRTAVLDPYA
jgi:MFS family permease